MLVTQIVFRYISFATKITEKMSGKPTLKPPGKRASRKPEPTGDSSDSSRSKSLSPWRSSSRRIEAKKAAKAQSKWTLSQNIQNSSESDGDEGLASDTGRTTRFRRSKELKGMVEATNAEALAKFKIPKTSKKALGAALADGQDKAESESNFKNQFLSPTGSGVPGDAGDDNLLVGPSGKVIGYRTESQKQGLI